MTKQNDPGKQAERFIHSIQEADRLAKQSDELLRQASRGIPQDADSDEQLHALCVWRDALEQLRSESGVGILDGEPRRKLDRTVEHIDAESRRLKRAGYYTPASPSFRIRHILRHCESHAQPVPGTAHTHFKARTATLEADRAPDGRRLLEFLKSQGVELIEGEYVGIPSVDSTETRGTWPNQETVVVPRPRLDGGEITDGREIVALMQRIHRLQAEQDAKQAAEAEAARLEREQQEAEQADRQRAEFLAQLDDPRVREQVQKLTSQEK